MTKVIKIHVKNLKAVSDITFDSKGCTAIINVANNSGKSSTLKSLIERIQSKSPN